MDTNIFRALRQASRAITASFETGSDITLPQYLILEALGEESGQTQVALSQVTCIDRTTLSQILRRMEQVGLVRTEKNKDDLRVSLMFLTEEGRRELRKHKRRADRLTARLCENEAASAKLVADLVAVAERVEKK